MSPNLHQQIARSSQREIDVRTAHAHHRHELRAATPRERRVARSGLRRSAIAIAFAMFR